MPFESQAQRGLFYATAEGAKTGVPMKVAKEFISADKPGKLPEHVRPHHAFGGGLGHGDPLGGLASLHAPKLGAITPIKPPKAASVNIPHPWFERQEARGMSSRSGFADGGAALPDMNLDAGIIPGSGGGRTDRVPLSVPVDSHVLTADTVSGMGQNHTLNGWRNLLGALRVGPYDVPDPSKISGHGPPRAPALPRGAIEEKHGGATKGDRGRVSILGASGEAVIPFEDWVAKDPVDGKLYIHRGVRSLGRDWHELNQPEAKPTNEQIARKGHDVLDDLTRRVRAFNIAWLKSAPKPKRAVGGAVGLAA